MSFYTKLKIVLIMIISIMVSFFTYTYLKNLKDNVTVVIAMQDIDAHTIIKPEMIQEVEISRKDKEILAKDGFATKIELENAISNVKIEKNKVIIKNEDVIAGTKEEMIEKKAMLENGEINNSYFVSDNKRITTVSLDSEGAVGNKLNIGDYVDVIFSLTGDEKTSFSATIIQHVEIYDIEGSGSLEAAKNISLIVTPQQAADITYAKRQGKVDLALDSLNGNSQTVSISNIDKLKESVNSK